MRRLAVLLGAVALGGCAGSPVPSDEAIERAVMVVTAGDLAAACAPVLAGAAPATFEAGGQVGTCVGFLQGVIAATRRSTGYCLASPSFVEVAAAVEAWVSADAARAAMEASEATRAALAARWPCR
jgi:hypothetical protein